MFDTYFSKNIYYNFNVFLFNIMYTNPVNIFLLHEANEYLETFLAFTNIIIKVI